MPVTLVHPAAALPLARPLGRAGVPSALVIGSVVPDIGYLLFLPIPRDWTHSLLGLFAFCLPVGALVYLAFHRLLKAPCTDLLPAPWQARLHGAATGNAPWLAVAASLLAGAATHLAWDAFSHAPGAGVQAFPALRARWFVISGYPVFAYKALQHVSTAIGLVLLVVWLQRWLARTPPAPDAPAPRLPTAARRAVVGAVLALATAFALAMSAPRLPVRHTLRAFQPFAATAVIAALGAANAGLLLYAASWHAARALRAADRPRAADAQRIETG